MTSTAIKTTLFALLVLSITVPSTVFATTHDLTGENMTAIQNATSTVSTGENMTSIDKVEMSNSTENDTDLPLISLPKPEFESWENIHGEMVSVSHKTAEKLLERGYLVGQLIVN